MSEEKQKYQLSRAQFTQQPLLPIFSEVLNRLDYVLYGEGNIMPQYLISRYNNCAINKAIVTSKKEQIMYL